MSSFKAQSFHWYEYNSKTPFQMVGSKENRVYFEKGDKFGIKMSSDGNSIHLVTHYDLNKIFKISPEISFKLSKVAISSVFEKEPEAEFLQEQEYYEISDADKKIFTKLITDYVNATTAESEAYEKRGSGGKHDWYKQEVQDKFANRQNEANEKFKEKFKDIIPAKELKNFTIGQICDYEYVIENMDSIMEEFLMKPVKEPKKTKSLKK